MQGEHKISRWHLIEQPDLRVQDKARSMVVVYAVPENITAVWRVPPPTPFACQADGNRPFPLDSHVSVIYFRQLNPITHPSKSSEILVLIAPILSASDSQLNVQAPEFNKG